MRACAGGKGETMNLIGVALFIAAISMAAVEQCVNDVWPSIIQVLTSILQLEEFKRSTDVCKNVLSTAYTLTTLET